MSYKTIKNLMFVIAGFLLIIASIMPKDSWSYFNDIEAIPKTIAAGTCSFEVLSEDNLNFTLIPDLEDERELVINIKDYNKDVTSWYFETDLDESSYSGDIPFEDFASAFKVKFSSSNEEMDNIDGTLADLESDNANEPSEFNKEVNEWLSREELEEKEIKITISFVEGREEFQEQKLDVKFDIEGICEGNYSES